MAISEDTKAIISQLQSEGELIRNTGANSLREVNVRLDKFSDAFVSIAANISGNNQMLQNSQKALKEQAEYERQQRDFDDLKRDKEVKVKEKGDLGIKEGLNDIKGALAGFSMTGLLGGIGKAIGIGLGAAAAGNLLKGFVDERYDGAFTNLQNSITGIDFESINKSIKDMQFATDNLVEQMKQINETVKSITDNILFKLVTTVGVLTTIQQTFKRIIGPYFKDIFDQRKIKRRAQLDMFRNADRLSMENFEEFQKRNNRAPLGDFDGPNNLGTPEFDTNNPKIPLGTATAIDMANPSALQNLDGRNVYTAPKNITETPRQRYRPFAGGFGNLSANQGGANFVSRAQVNRAIVDSGTGPNGERGVGRSPGAQAGFKKPKGSFLSQAEMDKALRELGQLKLFKEVVKGLVFVGVAWTIYDSINLYYAWAATPPGPKGDEARKQILINEFAALVTGAGGAALGAYIGIFGGPWGILIGSIVGGVAGSLMGPYVVGAIYDWANEVPLTKEQALADVDARIAQLEGNYETGPNLTDAQGHFNDGVSDGIKALVARRNSLVGTAAAFTAARKSSSSRNQVSMENAAYGTGGRRMYEIANHGSPQQKAVLLDALLSVESRYQQGMSDIQAYLDSANGTTVINAPTNVNPNITNTHGGNSKSEVNVLGGMGMDPLIYGLPFIAQ